MFQHSGFHATTCIKTSEVDWHGHLLQLIEASDIFGQAGVSLTQNNIVSFRLRWALKLFWCCFLAKKADGPLCLSGCGCFLWGTWLVWINEVKGLGHSSSFPGSVTWTMGDLPLGCLEIKWNTSGYYYWGILHVTIRIIPLPIWNKYKHRIVKYMPFNSFTKTENWSYTWSAIWHEKCRQ